MWEREAMRRLRNSLLVLLVFAVLIGLVTGAAKTTTENFTVPPRSEVTRLLSLQKNDRVVVSFSVIGESSHELNFYLTDPNGKTILRYDRVGQTSFSFFTELAGTYVLHFDNSLSSEGKMVTLNYDVEHFILGMPQTLFLVLVIVGVLVLMIAAFVMMGKPR